MTLDAAAMAEAGHGAEELLERKHWCGLLMKEIFCYCSLWNQLLTVAAHDLEELLEKMMVDEELLIASI
ncbi:hypothetical protein D5086_027136 [Populus alba]|uniref:Uncharacterized protein n=1 Tax=Populus alba TaxID=43335 RepID=A0ACC4B5A8_POPAL